MAEQRTAGFMDSTRVVILYFFLLSARYIQNGFAEPRGSGEAVRLFNFISEWIAASGDSRLFVYRLL